MDIVLHGDEYDDHDGTNHDDDDAADASNNRPRGGGVVVVDGKMARPSIRNQALVLVQPVTFDALATAGHRQ